LQVEVGGLTVGERLERAIAAGVVIRREDGRLSLASDAEARGEIARKGWFLGQQIPGEPGCHFLNDFLFDQAYGEAAVPFGCRTCFKIKVSTRTLRAMMAVKGLAEATGHTTKSGSDVNNPTNTDLYSTYLYFDGLPAARETYRSIRKEIDEHPQLGPDVAATIKRGCTNYERKLGPSDRYAFDPRLEDAETYLAQRFVDEKPPRVMPKDAVMALRMLRLIETAYRIGDETYTDFTDGQPLFAPTVSYALEAEADNDAEPGQEIGA